MSTQAADPALASSSAAASAALPFRRRFGYGVGDFGFNLFFTTAQLYLLYYYTDVLGLSPGIAGWVFAGALVWDAVFDPLMGYIASRTRTRWGKYRPYILFGTIPMSAAWILMFVPTDFTGTSLVIFAAATHILFRTFYAVVSMPYLALSAVITSDSQERGVLAGFRMVSAAGCGLLAAFFTLQLVEYFGGGQIGFFWVAVLYGTISSAILLFSFLNTEELADIEDDSHLISASSMGTMLRNNTAFWLVAGAMLAGGIGGTMFSKMLPYYFKYALLREDLIGPALAVVTGIVMLSIPLWTFVMKRTSKRTMWLLGLTIVLPVLPVLWFVPDTPGLTLALLAVYAVGAGAGLLGFWAMMPDTVEYGEWKSGIRAEGAVFGFVSLIQKGALGIAAGVLGEMLEFIGYQANQPQSAQTLVEMKIIMFGMPFIFNLAALAFVFFYPLTPKVHAGLLRELAERRAARTQGVTI